MIAEHEVECTTAPHGDALRTCVVVFRHDSIGHFVVCADKVCGRGPIDRGLDSSSIAIVDKCRHAYAVLLDFIEGYGLGHVSIGVTKQDELLALEYVSTNSFIVRLAASSIDLYGLRPFPFVMTCIILLKIISSLGGQTPTETNALEGHPKKLAPLVSRDISYCR